MHAATGAMLGTTFGTALGTVACSSGPRYAVQAPSATVDEQSPGSVLFVLSSAKQMRLRDDSVRQTGTFLSEFYEAYAPLQRAGYRIDLATPDGLPVSIDAESLKEKYWQDPKQRRQGQAVLQQAAEAGALLSLSEALRRAERYQGVVVPGGQAVLQDLVDHPVLHQLLTRAMQRELPVGLICHAPLLLTRLAGETLASRQVTSVSGFEEWFIETFIMGAEAVNRGIGGQLESSGYRHDTGFPGSSHALRDCNLVTSQNPYSGAEFSQLYLQALDDYRKGARCRERDL